MNARLFASPHLLSLAIAMAQNFADDYAFKFPKKDVAALRPKLQQCAIRFQAADADHSGDIDFDEVCVCVCVCVCVSVCRDVCVCVCLCVRVCV